MSEEAEIPDEVIQEARSMGWRPQEEFKGNPEKWVPADEFVEKGRHVMPILLENNKRMAKDLLTRDQKIGTLEKQLKELKDAQDQLLAQATKANEREVANAKANLVKRLKEAREDNDVDAELEIREALDKLKETPVPAKKQEAAPQPKAEVSPEFAAWQEENPWFGGESAEDKKKTKAFLRIGEDLRDEGSKLVGRDFMEEVARQYEEQFGERKAKESSTNKYDSGSNRGGARGTASKSYESMPAEAKQACMEDADALVGDGKKFKSLKDWQGYYAKVYWESN